MPTTRSTRNDPRRSEGMAAAVWLVTGRSRRAFGVWSPLSPAMGRRDERHPALYRVGVFRIGTRHPRLPIRKRYDLGCFMGYFSKSMDLVGYWMMQTASLSDLLQRHTVVVHAAFHDGVLATDELVTGERFVIDVVVPAAKLPYDLSDVGMLALQASRHL